MVSPARALRREGFSGNAKTYTGESAARPPGRGDGADVGEGHAASPGSLTGILPSEVRQISRGSNQHTQKAQLTIFCTQVAPTPASGRPVHWELAAPQGDRLRGPETLIGKQPRRPIHGADSYLHSPRWRKAAENNEMPQALRAAMTWPRQLGLSRLQPGQRKTQRPTHWDWEQLRPKRRKSIGRQKTNADVKERRPNANWT